MQSLSGLLFPLIVLVGLVALVVMLYQRHKLPAALEVVGDRLAGKINDALATHAAAITQAVQTAPPVTVTVSQAPGASGAALAQKIEAARPTVAAQIDRAAAYQFGVAAGTTDAVPTVVQASLVASTRRTEESFGPQLAEWYSANFPGEMGAMMPTTRAYLAKHPEIPLTPEGFARGRTEAVANASDDDKTKIDANAARAGVMGGGLVGVGRCSDDDGFYLWAMASQFQASTGKNIFSEMLQGMPGEVNAFIDAHEMFGNFDVAGYQGQFRGPVLNRINGL